MALQCLVVRDTFPHRKNFEGIRFLRAESPLGRIHRTKERRVVPPGQHPHVAERVLHFASRVESDTGPHPIRDTGSDERFLNGARTLSRAVEHRELFPAAARLMKMEERLDEPGE